LSNTNEAHWLHIAEKHFEGMAEDYFDHLFLSQEMHMAKPNDDIFLAVLEQLGAKAEECLFIDDAQANVDAAQALGYNVYKAPVKYDFRNEILNILNPMTYTSTIIVEEKHLACTVGSGDLPVLATPMMVALMENAAMLCVQGELAEGESTVGSHISVSHVKPTALGKKVSATATLLSREGRKLTFHVEAHDEQGLIGEGNHVRYIINKEKFLSKL
jgi:predicted thioesterase